MCTTIIVLCGGAARRAGGVDKPLLELAGAPVVAHAIRELAGLGRILLSANRNLEQYAEFGEVITDQDYAGPLAGILAGLSRAVTSTALVCPGDCPGMSKVLAERLLAAVRQQADAHAVALAHDGDRAQHLHLALHVQAAGPLETYLAGGGRSVRGWLERMPTVEVDCRDLAPAFDDVDRPEDLARWRARLCG